MLSESECGYGHSRLQRYQRIKEGRQGPASTSKFPAGVDDGATCPPVAARWLAAWCIAGRDCTRCEMRSAMGETSGRAA
jgi:hypothetical protein